VCADRERPTLRTLVGVCLGDALLDDRRSRGLHVISEVRSCGARGGISSDQDTRVTATATALYVVP
jgi:hypothetical protein